MKKFVRLISLVMAVSLALMMVAMAGACNHVWTKWTTKIPPTCLEEGEQESSCDSPKCGTHATRPVAKLDHYYVPATCTRKAHCVNGCDEERGELLPHTLQLQPAYNVLNVPSAALKRGRLVDTILYRQAVCSLRSVQNVAFSQKN